MFFETFLSITGVCVYVNVFVFIKNTFLTVGHGQKEVERY